MIILGINAFHGDASAALLVDGELVAAAEEERFTRVKHAAGFPDHAVRFCLAHVGARLQDVTHVAVARDPWARWPRKLLQGARQPWFALDRGRVVGKLLGVRHLLARAAGSDSTAGNFRVHRVEHHRAHLASAYLTSAVDRAALLSLDGMGDFASGSWGVGEGTRMRIRRSVAFPDSLGILYTALSQYLGFWQYGDEYKVMGLAALGAPVYRDQFRQLVCEHSQNGYQLCLTYFAHHRSHVSMTWDRGAPEIGKLFTPALERLLGPARVPGAPLEERFAHIAASLQARIEEIIVLIARRLHASSQCRSLAYAGGVAYNCVANTRLLADSGFETLLIPSAPGDAGLAVGAALTVWNEVLGQSRRCVLRHAYWGPEFDDVSIERALTEHGLTGRRLDRDALPREVAHLLADGQVVAWFQGRAEWGPRALGARSLLADPRRFDMRERLNKQIKSRESFRPFAPSVLAERTADWFESPHPSPFMSFAPRLHTDRRARVPAVTHMDGSARLQTVTREVNPLFWQLLTEFEALTGVPMVLNTSFNENEPIVNTPAEAIDCFLRTGLDALAIGSFLVRRPSLVMR